MNKQNKTRNQFLPKKINLFSKEERSEAWEKSKRIAKMTALVFSLFFVLATLSTLSYFWFLSSYGASLEKRADRAKSKILSLKKEEETYLFLTKKIEGAQQILSSRGDIGQFLKETANLLPPEVTSHSLVVKKTGRVRVTFSSPLLSQIEDLSKNLKKAIAKEKIVDVKLGDITKGESLYKLDLEFQVRKNEN